jgi:hypothetical protein
LNAITYKDIYSLALKGKIWMGCNFDMKFMSRDNGIEKEEVIASAWFTNLNTRKRYEDLILYKKYNEVDYPKYDNSNAISVKLTKDIPIDYDGEMGVPISFMRKYNPNQFELIKFRKGDDEKDLRIDGEIPYFRIIIKKKVK